MGKKKLWIYITWMWYFASAQGPIPSSMLCWFHACFQRHFQAPPWWYHCGKYHSQCTFTSCCDLLCYLNITSHLNFFYWQYFRKSKLGWDQQVSCVTLRTQSKMGHGNSQELVLSNAMTRYIYLCFFFPSPCCSPLYIIVLGFVWINKFLHEQRGENKVKCVLNL